jgi:hypothetical protein
MINYHEQALSALKTFVVNGGGSITDDDLSIFEKKLNEMKQHAKYFQEIYNTVFRGFFQCASKGLILAPERRVAEMFGDSIEDNYPEANEIFLKFARTYWTLKVVVHDLMENDIDWGGAHILVKLEQDIGPVFFPFPGPKRIAPSIREKFQRQLLKDYKANIDIEEFMKGNPILIRDRASKRGCLGIFLLLFAITIFSCWGILFLVRRSTF